MFVASYQFGLDESHKRGTLDFHVILLLIRQRDLEVEEVALAQVARRLLVENAVRHGAAETPASSSP